MVEQFHFPEFMSFIWTQLCPPKEDPLKKAILQDNMELFKFLYDRVTYEAKDLGTLYKSAKKRKSTEFMSYILSQRRCSKRLKLK